MARDDRATTISDDLGTAAALILFVLVVILLSPILISVNAFLYIKNGLSRRRYRKYLKHNEGAKFFCYTSRKTSENYVEENILPFIPADVLVLHLQDKTWFDLGDPDGIPVQVVGQMKNVRGGFPYVSKVVGGELVTESINNRLYSAITRKASAENIVQRINRFYET